ncbi:MAG: 5-methyltetrahydropteroyltriglutamate--homocysteine S-methyltransferase, partial [Sedimentisphaerales bacterium]|nr:5-methyltetrahydropteroyltriglutamate--homocysteine S-methyltransferase [Sedimentisphaerales bacterium]
VAPMEMTKWFNTNYHYIVPEFEANQTFSLGSTKVIDEFIEAKNKGILTRPVLLGPVSFLLLGKSKGGDTQSLHYLDDIAPIYREVLSRLSQEGAQWVQIDEPILVQDLTADQIDAFAKAYRVLLGNQNALKICLATYFGSISDKIQQLVDIPFDAIHLDLVSAPDQLDEALDYIREPMMLSLGIVNGRNIWKTNLTPSLCTVDKAVQAIGKERLIISPSCSLLHCPIDLDREENLATEIRERLAFAKQKLHEITVLQKAAEQGWNAVQDEPDENQAVWTRSQESDVIHNATVQERMRSLNESMFSRSRPYSERKVIQREKLHLPELPTTTIGSFPQTRDIQKARADYKKGVLSEVEYQFWMAEEIKKTIRFQENIGLDVLVHGEPERNDMVEYFGQMLNGFAFTQNGWVQSYGSRCVKPPIIYGDVSRPGPMTVEWIRLAQSFTDKPVKGMLTGPVTILQWSFVREDQPRKDTAWQIALCIRDEVNDLEKAGISIIQIDEPALREGVPLKQSEWPEYYDWAVKAFRLATSGVEDSTQIHTHMCYCDFNDSIEAIAALDADVISIEASRSDSELLKVFAHFNYPNDVGPGVYDIHSPRVPSVAEIKTLLQQMLKMLRCDQLWVNPDCGLKTRDWPEVEQSLKNMVDAASELRDKL